MSDKTQIGRASDIDSHLPPNPSTPARSAGLDATLASGAPPARGGVDAAIGETIAVGSQPPSGIDDTMAPSDGRVSAPLHITIRPGRRNDYDDLLTIDRQHYVVGDEIARGGMGRILVARDRRLGRQVAIKELLIDSPDLRARFEREARITAKLQHPSIVNILEAGTWPDGDAFYVMKLVTGESLDKVIVARPTLDKRLALLPNVIAAVDALAYAHANRVIHRDLKPANVLVGDYGETVVIDWGLAKDLADTSDTSDLPAGPYRAPAGAAGETVVGAVMGTPAYMPVEQALGEAVDERADVYSLGAMLYHVLAGQPPFTGKTADSILAQVIAEPVVPLDKLLAGVPPDLVTIVNKALAKAAADRYPTAKELAEDLKRFQTGQLVAAHRYSRRDLVLRWLRRNRAVVSVAGLALVVLGVVAFIGIDRIREERSVAEQNGALAVTHRNDSEEILAFLLTDLRDKLQRTGQAKVLADVAQRVNTYYDARAVNIGDVQDVEKRGLALVNLAKATGDFGDTRGGRALYVRAADLMSAALAVHPDNPRFFELRYRARIQDAFLLEPSDPQGARTALDVILATRPPANSSNADQLLALGHQARGRAAMHLGDNKTSLADFIESRDASRRYLASAPADPGRARDAAESELFLAEQYAKVTRLDDALGAAQRAVAICDAALAGHHDDIALLEQRARAMGTTGDIHQAARRLPDAMQAYTAYVAAYEKVYALDPSAPISMRMLGKAYENLAMIEVMSSNLPSAVLHMDRVQAIREQLHQRDPDEPTWARDLSVAYQRIAYFHQLKADVPGAIAFTDKSIAVLDRLVAQDPKNVVWQRDLAVSLFTRGETLASQGKFADSLASLRRAESIFVTLGKLEPAVVLHRRDLAILRDRIGTAIANGGDWDGATAEMAKAIAEFEPTVIANPKLDEFAMPLATLYRLHATFMSRTKASVADVLKPIERSVAILRPVYARHPTDGNFDFDLATSLSTLADMLTVNIPERRKEAYVLDEECEKLLVAARQRDPSNQGVKARYEALRNSVTAKARGWTIPVVAPATK